jgi:hypothetical protein
VAVRRSDTCKDAWLHNRCSCQTSWRDWVLSARKFDSCSRWFIVAELSSCHISWIPGAVAAVSQEVWQLQQFQQCSEAVLIIIICSCLTVLGAHVSELLASQCICNWITCPVVISCKSLVPAVLVMCFVKLHLGGGGCQRVLHVSKAGGSTSHP